MFTYRGGNIQHHKFSRLECPSSSSLAALDGQAILSLESKNRDANRPVLTATISRFLTIQNYLERLPPYVHGQPFWAKLRRPASSLLNDVLSVAYFRFQLGSRRTHAAPRRRAIIGI